MEYLLRAFKKQRRRLVMENLILLLLRCLIPILLALALARPLFRDSGFLPTIGTAHHILVFDRSYSMGYQPAGSQSPHTKAVRHATRRLEQLEDKSGQKVTLVLAGVRPEIPVRGNPNMTAVRARLARLGPPTDSAESLVLALGQVAELLEEEKANPGDTPAAETRVYIFTDCHKRCFGDDLAEPEDPSAKGQSRDAKKLAEDSARDTLDRIREHARITVLDMGGANGRSFDNVQVTGLTLERSHAVAGVPLTARVLIRNLTGTTQNVEVTLKKDGQEPTRRLVRVEAGAESEVQFPVLFRKTGYRQLEASIQTDGLEADNVCHRVVDVQERLRVLLVEGSLEHEWRLMDSGWLRVVLDPTEGKGAANVTEFDTLVIDSTAFLLGQEKLLDYHMIVLANVERLNEKVADDILAAVEAGTGLLVMFGERCDAASYNLYLYGDGDGPMPIRIAPFEGYDPGGKRYYRNQVIDLEHPVFRDFKEDESLLQVLQLGGIYRYARSDRESLHKDAKVIWQISSPELWPLLIAGRFGEGRTLFLTSAITTQPNKSNTLDAPVHSMPLFHPIAHWLTHPVTDPFNVTVGGSLTAIVHQRPHDLAVVLPEGAGGGKVPVAQDGRPMRGGLFALPTFSQTDFAGIYTFEMDLLEQGSTEQLRLPFAVNPDPTEGELNYLPHSVLRDRLGLENVHEALPDDSDTISTAGISELGPFLLYVVLFFILSEACWARFVSRRRN